MRTYNQQPKEKSKNLPPQGINRTELQPKLKVGKPGDKYEREADRIAEEIMRADSEITGIYDHENAAQRNVLNHSAVDSIPPIVHNVLRSPGKPLDSGIRNFMESKLGYDFKRVRVHTDELAAESARAVSAKAYTVSQNVVFASGEYIPYNPAGKQLLAHELVHVMQQRANGSGSTAQLQRVIEVRPPGRGEASAFERRQELIDRLNNQSTAIQYSLEGRVLQYEVIDESSLTHFDRQMMVFIDRDEVVPIRLITGEGYVRGPSGTFEPLLHDSWVLGYVDLDDLLASDDLGFQSQLIHILAERFATRNYERRIGTTTFTLPEFERVHRIAYEAEAELFRNIFSDPSIRYLYSELRPNGTWVVAFQSSEGFRIFKVFRGAGQEIRGAEVWAQTSDGRHLTVEELRTEREAATAPEHEEELRWPGLE